MPSVNGPAAPQPTLPSFELPSIALSELPGIVLPDQLPSWMNDFQLPNFKLGDFPTIDLTQFGSLNEVVLPSIDLADFPGVSLPDANFKLKLPTIFLSEYPNVTLPDQISLPKIKLTTKAMKIGLMKVKIGGSLMKLKLFLGFVQCVSNFPITFSSIPFPATYINLGKFLELFSCDLLSVFGGTACHLHTGFYNSFNVSFSTIPVIIGATLLSYGFVMIMHSKKSKYTKESAATSLYSLLFMIVYR